MLKKGILFGLIVLFAIVFGFISFRDAPGEAVSLVRRYGYWFVFAGFALFSVCLVRSLWDEVRAALAKWKFYFAPLAVVCAASAFLHVHERHEFKIVMDEVVLQDTAMRMHFDREAGAMVRGYELAGDFVALHVYVDKRPLFFPFLLSLVHDVTGYRVANAFFLNALLSMAFMGLTFIVGHRLGGRTAGIAATLLIVSIPLVHQNAVSSGFELLNLLMILATLWLAMRFVERPEDPDRLGAFVFAGILLAQTRYESALFIFPVGVTILYTWWRKRAIDLSWPILVAPILLVIVPLHYNVFRLSTTAWQMFDRPDAETPFSPRFFYDNVGHAMNFFFSIDGSQANSPLVAVLGLIGVGFFVLTIYREHAEIIRKHPDRVAFCIFILTLMAHTGLMLCYFWGQFDDPIIRRLSLPANLLMVLAFLFVWPRLVARVSCWRIVNFTTLLFIVGFTVPSVAEHRYTQENFAARTNSWLSDFIEDLGDDSAIAIDNGTGLQWLIHRKSTVPVSVLAARPQAFAFHFKNHSFKHYFVVQRMGSDFDKGTRFPTMDDEVGDGIQLEVVEERSFSPIYHIRISRVTGVDEEKVRAWADRRAQAVELTPEMKTAIRKTDADLLDRWFKMLP